MDQIRDAIVTLFEAEAPMTGRQVFYRLVGLGCIAKREPEYKHTVIRLLGEMRLDGTLSFDDIADNTRWMRKPQTHGSVAAMLSETARVYRRALWDNQDAYVEVWLEKDALAGVVYEVTDPWDAPLMVTRGYSSLSFLKSAAEAIEAIAKPTFIYYLGDHDPSGLDIPRSVEARLREFAPDCDITFTRIAVTPDQIIAWHLPTRPTKQTDSRSKGFLGGSVEVDAIPSDQLRHLVEEAITSHLDEDAVVRTRAIEAEERTSLLQLVRQWRPPKEAA